MVRWERVWEAQKYVLHFPNNKRKQRQDRVTELHLHCTSHWLLFWEEKGRQRVKALDMSQNCSSMLLIMFVGSQLGGLYQGWETKQVMLQSGICFLLIPVSSVLFAFRNQWATIMTDVPTSGCISCLEVHHIKVTFVLHGQRQLVLQVSYKDRDVSSLHYFLSQQLEQCPHRLVWLSYLRIGPERENKNYTFNGNKDIQTACRIRKAAIARCGFFSSVNVV